MTRLVPLTLVLSLALACQRDNGKSGDSGVVSDPEPAVDADGDGYAESQDCDDTDASVHPDAEEVCNGVDDDCDGAVDEDVMGTWYTDGDEDGYGDPDLSTQACGQPEGRVDVAGDCDDGDPQVHPDADERCNGVDDDCDGAVDEDVTSAWYADADGDGYGDAAAVLDDCDPPSGYVSDDTDCDDADASVHPEADEVCNGRDDDCDGTVDEDAVDAATWYADTDGDGYGDADTTVSACEAPSGYVADGTDCDDASAEVHPESDEVCDGVDDDCDGTVDEDAVDAGTWYADTDGDGYGDADTTVSACEAPSGYVADGTDCDDTSAAVSPSPATDEYCDGVDNDCDGTIDESDAVDASTWYADADGDGYGDAAASTLSCYVPSGYVSDDTDCDDTSASVYPGADEYCDGLDDDCDGSVDDSAVDFNTYYADDDGDGWGDPDDSIEACSRPSGYAGVKRDCDDTDAAINPDALEVCDGVDNDCDGDSDEADAWWDTSWPYRVMVTVDASSYDVDGPPVAVDVDFRAELDALGDSSAFDADTLRVVLQDCDLSQPELPSQFLDEWTGIFDKASSSDPAGDEAGSVVFLYDEDGDLSSLETLDAGSTVRFGLYFGGSATAPGYSTDLSASADQLASGVATADLDEDAGGLLDALSMDGSPTLMSQTESCCGNGIRTADSGWGNDPQDDSGTLTLLEEGPIFGAVEASGSRSDASAGFDYSYTYWMFAGRPELWSKVVQTTTVDTSLSHSTDATLGIRPWESRQDDVSDSSSVVFEADAALEYADTSNGTWGVSWGYAQPPTYVVDLSSYDPYLIVIGNDALAYGGGTTASLAAGTVYMDHVVQLVLPHQGDFADVDDTLFGLIDGLTISADAAEAQ